MLQSSKTGDSIRQDINKLKVTDIQSGIVEINENTLNLENIEDGWLTMSWNVDKPVDAQETEVLFSLVVDAQGETNISEAISIAEGSEVITFPIHLF